MKKMVFKQTWVFVALFLLTFVVAASAQVADKLVVKDATGNNVVFKVDNTGTVQAAKVGVNVVPTSQIEAQMDGGLNSDIKLKVASSGGGVPVFYGVRGGGSLLSPLATPSGKGLFWLGAMGYGASGWGTALTGLIGFWSTEAWTDTAMGTDMRFFTTPNGSSARAERMRVNADGTIIMNNLAGTYTNGSAYVCVNNSGQLYTSETGCP